MSKLIEESWWGQYFTKYSNFTVQRKSNLSMNNTLKQLHKNALWQQAGEHFYGMTGIPSVCGGSPQGAQLPTNPIATPKVCTVRYGREEGIAKSQPDEQKPNTKACIADKRAISREIQKATVTYAGRLGRQTRKD